MTVAEFLFAVEEQADQRAVDIAEAEQAEVVGVNACSSRRAKALVNLWRSRGAEAPLFHGCACSVDCRIKNRAAKADVLVAHCGAAEAAPFQNVLA